MTNIKAANVVERLRKLHQQCAQLDESYQNVSKSRIKKTSSSGKSLKPQIPPTTKQEDSIVYSKKTKKESNIDSNFESHEPRIDQRQKVPLAKRSNANNNEQINSKNVFSTSKRKPISTTEETNKQPVQKPPFLTGKKNILSSYNDAYDSKNSAPKQTSKYTYKSTNSGVNSKRNDIPKKQDTSTRKTNPSKKSEPQTKTEISNLVDSKNFIPRRKTNIETTKTSIETPVPTQADTKIKKTERNLYSNLRSGTKKSEIPSYDFKSRQTDTIPNINISDKVNEAYSKVQQVSLTEVKDDLFDSDEAIKKAASFLRNRRTKQNQENLTFLKNPPPNQSSPVKKNSQSRIKQDKQSGFSWGTMLQETINDNDDNNKRNIKKNSSIKGKVLNHQSKPQQQFENDYLDELNLYFTPQKELATNINIIGQTVSKSNNNTIYNYNKNMQLLDESDSASIADDISINSKKIKNNNIYLSTESETETETIADSNYQNINLSKSRNNNVDLMKRKLNNILNSDPNELSSSSEVGKPEIIKSSAVSKKNILNSSLKYSEESDSFFENNVQEQPISVVRNSNSKFKSNGLNKNYNKVNSLSLSRFAQNQPNNDKISQQIVFSSEEYASDSKSDEIIPINFNPNDNIIKPVNPKLKQVENHETMTVEKIKKNLLPSSDNSSTKSADIDDLPELIITNKSSKKVIKEFNAIKNSALSDIQSSDSSINEISTSSSKKSIKRMTNKPYQSFQKKEITVKDDEIYEDDYYDDNINYEIQKMKKSPQPEQPITTKETNKNAKPKVSDDEFSDDDEIPKMKKSPQPEQQITTIATKTSQIVKHNISNNSFNDEDDFEVPKKRNPNQPEPQITANVANKIVKPNVSDDNYSDDEIPKKKNPPQPEPQNTTVTLKTNQVIKQNITSDEFSDDDLEIPKRRTPPQPEPQTTTVTTKTNRIVNQNNSNNELNDDGIPLPRFDIMNDKETKVNSPIYSDSDVEIIESNEDKQSGLINSNKSKNKKISPLHVSPPVEITYFSKFDDLSNPDEKFQPLIFDDNRVAQNVNKDEEIAEEDEEYFNDDNNIVNNSIDNDGDDINDSYLQKLAQARNTLLKLKGDKQANQKKTINLFANKNFFNEEEEQIENEEIVEEEENIEEPKTSVIVTKANEQPEFEEENFSKAKLSVNIKNKNQQQESDDEEFETSQTAANITKTNELPKFENVKKVDDEFDTPKIVANSTQANEELNYEEDFEKAKISIGIKKGNEQQESDDDDEFESPKISVNIAKTNKEAKFEEEENYGKAKGTINIKKDSDHLKFDDDDDNKLFKLNVSDSDVEDENQFNIKSFDANKNNNIIDDNNDKLKTFNISSIDNDAIEELKPFTINSISANSDKEFKSIDSKKDENEIESQFKLGNNGNEHEEEEEEKISNQINFNEDEFKKEFNLIDDDDDSDSNKEEIKQNKPNEINKIAAASSNHTDYNSLVFNKLIEIEEEEEEEVNEININAVSNKNKINYLDTNDIDFKEEEEKEELLEYSTLKINNNIETEEEEPQILNATNDNKEINQIKPNKINYYKDENTFKSNPIENDDDDDEEEEEANFKFNINSKAAANAAEPSKAIKSDNEEETYQLTNIDSDDDDENEEEENIKKQQPKTDQKHEDNIEKEDSPSDKEKKANVSSISSLFLKAKQAKDANIPTISKANIKNYSEEEEEKAETGNINNLNQDENKPVTNDDAEEDEPPIDPYFLDSNNISKCSSDSNDMLVNVDDKLISFENQPSNDQRVPNENENSDIEDFEKENQPGNVVEYEYEYVEEDEDEINDQISSTNKTIEIYSKTQVFTSSIKSTETKEESFTHEISKEVNVIKRTTNNDDRQIDFNNEVNQDSSSIKTNNKIQSSIPSKNKISAQKESDDYDESKQIQVQSVQTINNKSSANVDKSAHEKEEEDEKEESFILTSSSNLPNDKLSNKIPETKSKTQKDEVIIPSSNSNKSNLNDDDDEDESEAEFKFKDIEDDEEEDPIIQRLLKISLKNKSSSKVNDEDIEKVEKKLNNSQISEITEKDSSKLVDINSKDELLEEDEEEEHEKNEKLGNLTPKSRLNYPAKMKIDLYSKNESFHSSSDLSFLNQSDLLEDNLFISKNKNDKKEKEEEKSEVNTQNKEITEEDDFDEDAIIKRLQNFKDSKFTDEFEKVDNKLDENCEEEEEEEISDDSLIRRLNQGISMLDEEENNDNVDYNNENIGDDDLNKRMKDLLELQISDDDDDSADADASI